MKPQKNRADKTNKKSNSAGRPQNRRLDKTKTQGYEDEKLIIKGRHEVISALSGAQKLEAVYLSQSLKPPIGGKIRQLAKDVGVTVKEINSEAFGKKFGDKSQGVAAIGGAFTYTELDRLITSALRGQQILVALNQVEDARNLGAIIRTVEAAGASGVIIPKHRAAGMTEWAVRTAQGAAAYLPVARVTNMADAINFCKKQGFWAVGLEAGVKKKYCDTVYKGPILLVAGGENIGLGERVKKSCDELVTLPLSGNTSSLNVSVSVAVGLFEICRQKNFFQNK
jgi:23S rRNA (guanosine2251-2'-O)-methyltransferase